MTPTGRPAGPSRARETILKTARAQFAARGYDRATLRAIAESAHVDPALIIHYFGSKEALFDATIGLPGSPREIFADAVGRPADEAATLIVRRFLEVMDAPNNRQVVLALVRSAVSHERVAGLLRRALLRGLVEPLAARGGPDATVRASLVAAHLVGLSMQRYVVRLPALTRARPDDLVRLVAPAIATYLEPGPSETGPR